MAARSTRTCLYLNGALLAVVLASSLLMGVPVCDAGERAVDSAQPEKGRVERERCKRVEGRLPRGCPDGGERLPQDKRSPLDTLPPLSPLVA